MNHHLLALALASLSLSCKRDAPSSSTSVASAAESIYVSYPGAPTAPWGREEFFDPEASRPATRYSAVSISVTGVLTEDRVRGMLASHENSWRYCFWSALASKPGLAAGEAVATFDVVDGKLQTVAVVGTTLHDAGVLECIKDALGSLVTMPRAEPGRSSVKWTFSLGPG